MSITIADIPSLTSINAILSVLNNDIHTLIFTNIRVDNIESLEDLHYIHLLQINGLKFKISKLPKLPPNLQWLNCSDQYLKELPPLPDTLTHLFCDKNTLRCLPKKLPKELKILNCEENYNLHYLPDELPPNLEELYVSNCDLYYLPDLPETLKHICMQWGYEMPRYPNLIKYKHDTQGMIEYVNTCNSHYRIRERVRKINQNNILASNGAKKASNITHNLCSGGSA